MSANLTIPHLSAFTEHVRQRTGYVLAVVTPDAATATDVLRFTEYADEMSARKEYDRIRRDAEAERAFLAVGAYIYTTTPPAGSIEAVVPIVSASVSKTWRFQVTPDSSLPLEPIKRTPPAPRPKAKPVAPAQTVLRAPQAPPSRWLALRRFFDLA